jgi:hypothetical protein
LPSVWSFRIEQPNGSKRSNRTHHGKPRENKGQ